MFSDNQLTNEVLIPIKLNHYDWHYLAAQGFFAAHGFLAAHGFFAAHGFLAAQGFFAAQGLLLIAHGFLTAHGLTTLVTLAEQGEQKASQEAPHPAYAGLIVKAAVTRLAAMIAGLFFNIFFMVIDLNMLG